MSAVVKDIPETREVVFGVGTPHEATASWKEAQATGFAFAVTLKFKNPKLNVRDEGWPVPDVKRIEKIQGHVRQYWARMCEIFKSISVSGKRVETFLAIPIGADRSQETLKDVLWATQNGDKYIGKWVALVNGEFICANKTREGLARMPFFINATLVAYVSAR